MCRDSEHGFRSGDIFLGARADTERGLAFLGNSFSDLRVVLTPATDHSQQPAGPGPDRKLKPSLDCLDE